MSEQQKGQSNLVNTSSVPALVAGLGELPSLLMATDAIDEVVWETAMLAVRASEDIDACGVTVLREGKAVSLLPAAAPYAELEERQYASDDGPAMEAMRSRQAVSVPDMAEDTRWGDYSQQASAVGVGSSLSLPLIAGEQVLGAITYYSNAPRSIPDEFLLEQLIADLASTGLWCMLKHADKQQMSDQLQQALTSRADIDQAKGILIAQQGCSGDEAFDLLRQASQNRNVKLRDIAKQVVDQASGGAKS
ncbi:GAF and ANTAR domain-containing protein [Saccharopolyspora sp. NPDC002578]